MSDGFIAKHTKLLAVEKSRPADYGAEYSRQELLAIGIGRAFGWWLDPICLAVSVFNEETVWNEMDEKWERRRIMRTKQSISKRWTNYEIECGGVSLADLQRDALIRDVCHILHMNYFPVHIDGDGNIDAPYRWRGQEGFWRLYDGGYPDDIPYDAGNLDINSWLE